MALLPPLQRARSTRVHAPGFGIRTCARPAILRQQASRCLVIVLWACQVEAGLASSCSRASGGEARCRRPPPLGGESNLLQWQSFVQRQVPPQQQQPQQQEGGDATSYARELLDALTSLGSDQGSRAGAAQVQAPTLMPTSTTARPGVNQSTSAFRGVAANRAGDLAAFNRAVTLNLGLVLFCVLFMTTARWCFPLVYSSKTEAVSAELVPIVAGMGQGKGKGKGRGKGSGKGKGDPPTAGRFSGGCFGWIRDAAGTSFDEVVQAAGLDHAMLLEFTRFAMQVFAVIGLPSFCILSPLYFFFGGAKHSDMLSKGGFGNVKRDSWLCWVMCFFVWYVVLIVEVLIQRAMTSFVSHRHKWLHGLTPPRSRTILVERIPEGKNTRYELRSYFEEQVFGHKVIQEIHIIKDFAALLPWQRQLEQVALKIEMSSYLGKVSLINSTLAAEKSEAERQLAVLGHKISTDDTLNTHSAFVTFTSRRSAIVSLKIFSEDDNEEITASMAVEPQDIIWEGFLFDPKSQQYRYVLGQVMVAGLFLGFLPMVVAISWVTSLESLGKYVPTLITLVRKHPSVAATWDGVMASASLNLLLSYIPTFLAIIFSKTFVIKATTEMQFRIQQLFFYFLVAYILLVTAIASGIFSNLITIAKHPPEVFAILATTLPNFTHFYLNYMLVQCGAAAMTLTRYQVLFKYICLARFATPRRAYELSEPEDQDYYGMGSRSARFALLFVVSLVYSSLAPLISFLAFITFGLLRLFLAYLFVHAESKKPDTGGIFWVRSLQQCQVGLLLYTLLMTGVLLQRASSSTPGVVAGFSILYVLMKLWHFDHSFRWVLLDFNEMLVEGDTVEEDAFAQQSSSYRQPGLPDSFLAEEEEEKEARAEESQLPEPPADSLVLHAQANIQQALRDVTARLGMGQLGADPSLFSTRPEEKAWGPPEPWEAGSPSVAPLAAPMFTRMPLCADAPDRSEPRAHTFANARRVQQMCC